MSAGGFDELGEALEVAVEEGFRPVNLSQIDIFCGEVQEKCSTAVTVKGVSRKFMMAVDKKVQMWSVRDIM